MNAQPKSHLGRSLCGALFVALSLLAACQSQPAPAPAAADRTYSFWPQFPDEPRVQFLASFSSSDDVEPVQSSGLERLVFGKESSAATSISKPYGVAAHAGKIYVTDMRGKALVVLDLKKKETRLVGVTGITPLIHPVAVAVADDGMIYVADNSRGSVFVYDAQERYSLAIGFPKFKPIGVAVHGDRLYAADMAGQNVVIFERKSGKKLGVIGTVGDEDGQFRVPIGVSTDREGNVYVMDMMACRLQKFTSEGAFISKMGSLGDYQGTFTRPKHIAVDSDGLIYIVDAAFENVQMFNPEYHLLMHFGALGDFPGAMNLPAGICVTDDGLDVFRDRLHPGFDAKKLVVVSNQFGPTKVVVYAVGQRRPDYPIAVLAKSAATLPTGTGVPSDEQLKMQNPGGLEPPPDEAKPGAAAGGKPDQTKPDQTKPDQPKPVKPEPPATPEPR